MSKIFITILLIIGCVLTFAPVVSAEQGVPIDPIFHPPGSPTATGDVPDISGTEDERKTKGAREYQERRAREFLLQRIIAVLLSIAGVVAIFSIVNNAWWLVVVGGKEESISQHKKGLTWAVLGLVLIILSYSILRWIIDIAFQADQQMPQETTAAAETAAPPSSQ